MTNIIKATFLIHGMNCKSCAADIMKALKKHKGVTHSELIYKEDKINISFDKTITNFKEINRSLEPLGYYLGHSKKDDIQIKSLITQETK
jgi:copper chaperone CopZ